MRLLYTTALYYDYVAKDIPLSELEQVESKVPEFERELLQA
jgi:pyrroloquinoline-quinone synthase